MAYQLIAPRMGEGIEELTLIRWLKNEGDFVKEQESIVEVETDKVVTELPSPASGIILKVLVSEGTAVKVGKILAWIGEPGEDISSTTPPAPRKETPSIPVETPAARSENQSVDVDKFLSPLVRKIAEENNVDLSQVNGTGKNNRITKKDVLDFLDKLGTDKSELLPAESPALLESGPTTHTSILPISSIRRTIADRMVNSMRISPHVLTVMESDLSQVLSHRALNKPLFEQDGVNLTLTAYFIAAIVEGLKANPMVNSSWTEDGQILHHEINIGMAVSLGPEGLIVPVIKNADALSLLGIARQVNDLATRARANKLKPEEVRGGTFSLTNHGLSGSLFASPIIMQPQVGILGTGTMQKRPIVITDEQGNDSIAIRPMIYMSFVFDHRALDGERADTFLKHVKETLESWK